MARLPPNQLAIRKAINGARAVYSIAKHPKLYLACTGTGGASWRIKYRPRPGMSQRWFTLSDDARNAEFEAIIRKATELLTNLALSGTDPHSERPRAASTFAQTYDLWLERYAKIHKKSWAEDEKLYKRHVDKRIGKDIARAIDRQRVIEVLDDIAAKATPLQANRCQSLISAVLSWALDEGRIDFHPALRIRRRGEERSRELVMSADQLKSFWPALDGLHDNATAMIKLLLFLGCRLGELSGAKKDELQLDISAPIWTIPSGRTKNGLTHILPLPPESVRLFRDMNKTAANNPFVFPARRLEPQALDGNQVSRQCKGAMRSVGVGEMRLHDLRHQAATGMAECGVSLDIRQLVQNQITGRRQSIGALYDQYDYAAEKRRALEFWERRLLTIIQGRLRPTERY